MFGEMFLELLILRKLHHCVEHERLVLVLPRQGGHTVRAGIGHLHMISRLAGIITDRETLLLDSLISRSVFKLACTGCTVTMCFGRRCSFGGRGGQCRGSDSDSRCLLM